MPFTLFNYFVVDRQENKNKISLFDFNYYGSILKNPSFLSLLQECRTNLTHLMAFEKLSYYFNI